MSGNEIAQCHRKSLIESPGGRNLFGERCDVTRKLGPCSPALHPRTDGTLRERTLNSFKPQEGPVPPCLHQSPRWPACCGALGWPGGLPGGNRQEDHRCPQTGLIRCPQSGLSIDDGLAHRIWKGALRTNFALGGGAAATESTICSQIALPLADGALVYRSAPRFGPTRGHRRPCWRPPVEVGPGKPQTQAEPRLDILELRRTFFTGVRFLCRFGAAFGCRKQSSAIFHSSCHIPAVIEHVFGRTSLLPKRLRGPGEGRAHEQSTTAAKSLGAPSKI